MHTAPIAPPMRALLFAALLVTPLFALPHAAADLDVCTPDAVASLAEACASRHNYIWYCYQVSADGDTLAGACRPFLGP